MNSNKSDLILLVHRIPFPPNKGDKIRSFHLLKHLNEHYNVHLVAFVDDEADWQYEDKLTEYCCTLKLFRLSPLKSKVKALKAFITNDALTIPYYYQQKVQRYIDKLINTHGIKNAMVYSSSMAQYLKRHATMNCVMDMVDVDSDKWQQYAENMSGLSKWVYQRECQKLAIAESKLVSEFKQTYLVSKKESELLRSRVLESSRDKVSYYNNGVDLDFFNANQILYNPFSEDQVKIVFTGAMDYWANVDAVKWFLDNCFATIKTKLPSAHFYIVGSNPNESVRKLSRSDVTVTGRVDDIRAYIYFADLCIAPMQIARGIQNKVLEALALNKRIAMTPSAYEGLVEVPFLNELCKSESNEYSQLCIDQLMMKDEPFSGREYVENYYSWENCLSHLQQQLDKIMVK